MNDANVSFSEALRFWFKLGFISFGGPAGQIAIMHRELVERRAWVSEERFLHALNFCMLLPGPEAQQLAIYIGWLKHRVLGGVVAGVLFVLPGFLLITGISLLYVLFQSLPVMQGILFGLKAAVLAVVLEAVHRIAKRALKDRFARMLAVGAFIGIFALGVPFPVIVLVAAVLGFLQQRWGGSVAATTALPVQDEPTVAKGYTLRVLLVCLALVRTNPRHLCTPRRFACVRAGIGVLQQDGCGYLRWSICGACLRGSTSSLKLRLVDAG